MSQIARCEEEKYQDNALVEQLNVETVLANRFETLQPQSNGYAWGQNHIREGGVFQCGVDQFVHLPIESTYSSFGNDVVEKLKAVQTLIDSYEDKNECNYANMFDISSSSGPSGNKDVFLQILVQNGNVFVRMRSSKSSATKDKIIFYGGLATVCAGAIGLGAYVWNEQNDMKADIANNARGLTKTSRGLALLQDGAKDWAIEKIASIHVCKVM
eukprot:522161_1